MEFPLLSNLEKEVTLPWASPTKKLLVFHLQFHDPSSTDTVPTEKKNWCTLVIAHPILIT
jgi:hypothetical protein